VSAPRRAETTRREHSRRAEDSAPYLPVHGKLPIFFGPAHGPWTAEAGARHSDAAQGVPESNAASECRAP